MAYFTQVKFLSVETNWDDMYCSRTKDTDNSKKPFNVDMFRISPLILFNTIYCELRVTTTPGFATKNVNNV